MRITRICIYIHPQACLSSAVPS
ncbi:hypothetical protein CBM2589_A90809 [Cupriavidus taiwanensis]|uniref:Uncharacterized protein n=1 Tax=Cupriavidus taiwanensis TaxID=164546 RepID=A0A975XGX6_9BURK|nr:hypothetical protein CBM2589_A90809 [Cupriavidus taiwanensis]